MNAGKSTTLLQASHNYQERGMDTLLFSPEVDDRYEQAMIYSRIGLKQPAIVFNTKFDFSTYLKEQKFARPNLKCILIDEAHFMTKAQVSQLTEITTELNIAVLCYGLRTDFLGEPFEGSKYLLAWAQELTEIKTICHCGRKATMNMRIDEYGRPVSSGTQIQIGGNESYISVCMTHYRENIGPFREIAKAVEVEA